MILLVRHDENALWMFYERTQGNEPGVKRICVQGQHGQISESRALHSFLGLGSALVAWPLLPHWAVGCGVTGAIFAVVILIIFAGREQEARIFFDEIPDEPISRLGLLWSIIGCIEIIPLLLMLVGLILTGFKLWGIF
jgi:hypothetical protein